MNDTRRMRASGWLAAAPATGIAVRSFKGRAAAHCHSVNVVSQNALIRASAAFTFLAISAAGSHAQESQRSDNPSTLPPVVVNQPKKAKAANTPKPKRAGGERSGVAGEASQSAQQGGTANGKVDEQGGFKPKTAQIGPFDSRSLQDIPYSVSVANSDMIKDRQATSLVDILKYMPSTQMEARGGLDVGRAQSRGMEAGVVDTNHTDGLNSVGTTALPLETFERVEVINSLAGAYYGPASPGGIFNYVLKRPTDVPLNEFTTGFSTNGGWLEHADVGGYVDDAHRLGYRINALNEQGDGFVKNSSLDRQLISAAVDVKPRSDTTVELNAYYYKFDKFGYPGGFSYGSTIKLPDAADPTTVGYGQSFAGMSLETSTLSFKVKHDLTENWRVSGGMLYQVVDRSLLTVTNTFQNNNYDYKSTMGLSAAGRFIVTSNTVNLNGRFSTGPIGHDLVIGTTGYIWEIQQAKTNNTWSLGSSNYYDPDIFASPNMSLAMGPRFKSGDNRQQTIVVGDNIKFDDQWSAMAVASYSWIDTTNYNTSGVQTGAYQDEGLSPTVALTYKPIKPVSVYAAYADTLEAGGTAPTAASNSGETLAPFRSEQYEAGIKTDFGKFSTALALFQIERPFAFTDTDNVYKVQGNQRNKGVEASITGEMLPDLRIYAGVTILDPILTDTGVTTTENKQVVGVPLYQANLLAEYALPWVEGLFVNFNIHYTGERAANNLNTTWADGYTTLDLGGRYETQVMGKKTTVRLAVNNVFDEKYWASIFPGSINGVVGSNTAFLGTPLEARLSASVKF